MQLLVFSHNPQCSWMTLNTLHWQAWTFPLLTLCSLPLLKHLNSTISMMPVRKKKRLRDRSWHEWSPQSFSPHRLHFTSTFPSRETSWDCSNAPSRTRVVLLGVLRRHGTASILKCPKSGCLTCPSIEWKVGHTNSKKNKEVKKISKNPKFARSIGLGWWENYWRKIQ